MSTPTMTRPTETRRRRRAPSSSSSSAGESDRTTPRGEAHYRDMMLLLQSEFTRVVTALETRATSLEQHNEMLQGEVVTLRDTLTAAKAEQQEQAESHATVLRLAMEQQTMLREEITTRAAEAARNEQEWREQCEQITLQLQTEQKQWQLEREATQAELQRVSKQLTDATTRLANEQQSNAKMSQELQLLQCRVDTAVSTSRSFEQRLQQLKQLKRDEKNDLEAHVAHLKKRLEDKKQQNQYLAEALMDKEARRAARKDQQKSNYATSSTNEVSPVKSNPAGEEMATRRRHHRADYQDHKSKLHRHQYHEELQSHAPTSPTSSGSPLLSPSSSSFTIRPTTPSTSASVSARSSVIQTQMSSTKTSSPSTRPRSTGSERLQRELDGLRRKFSACLATDTDQ